MAARSSSRYIHVPGTKKGQKEYATLYLCRVFPGVPYSNSAYLSVQSSATQPLLTAEEAVTYGDTDGGLRGRREGGLLVAAQPPITVLSSSALAPNLHTYLATKHRIYMLLKYSPGLSTD